MGKIPCPIPAAKSKIHEVWGWRTAGFLEIILLLIGAVPEIKFRNHPIPLPVLAARAVSQQTGQIATLAFALFPRPPNQGILGTTLPGQALYRANSRANEAMTRVPRIEKPLSGGNPWEIA
jgi:hypothetical protein